MKKFLALLLSCLMLVSVLSACGEKKPEGGNEPAEKVLNMRLAKGLLATDWAATTNTSDMQITWVQVFEGLYGMDEANGGYYNLLADKIDVSEDGKTFLYYYPGNESESFTVPEGVEVVAEGAFAHIPNLRELSFASTVRELDGWIFSYDFDTIGLKKLTIPASVESYRGKQFEIHSPTLEELIVLCEYASFHVAECRSLRSITIASVPTELSGDCLLLCESLHFIIVYSVSNGVKSVGNKVVGKSGEVDRASVCEVSSLCEAHSHYGVSRL